MEDDEQQTKKGRTFYSKLCLFETFLPNLTTQTENVASGWMKHGRFQYPHTIFSLPYNSISFDLETADGISMEVLISSSPHTIIVETMDHFQFKTVYA